MASRKMRRNPGSLLLWGGGGLAAAAVAYFVWWKPKEDKRRALTSLLHDVSKALANKDALKATPEQVAQMEANKADLLRQLEQL